jgi:tetratricopeptide (TPR) repeat protein
MLDPTSHDLLPDGLMRAPSLTDAACGEPLFVGRHAELKQLLSGLDVLKTGKGTAFAVSGEAGVGKTRLAAEFTSRARAGGACVVWGRCWEAGGAPSYWPWVEVIRRLVGEDRVDLGPHGIFLAQLVPELAERFGVASDAAPTPSDPDSARFRMFDAVATLLRRAAERGPLVVVIDDLHAADRASLLLLAFLARSLAECPVLLLGTYRDVDASASPDLAQPLAELGRHAQRIRLGGLSAGDISLLLRSASGSEPSAALVARIHDATAGNAFFVDEMLRSLAAHESPDDAHSLLVPDGVREAVRQRVAALPQDALATLELASVIGREFDATAVALAAQAPLADTLTALDHSVRAGIVVEHARTSGRFLFRHALLRDAVYEALSSAQRLALHQAVGDAFEQLAESAPDRYVGELAHHFLIAAPAGDARFVPYVMAAARRALARMAFEEAVALYQRAVDGLGFVQPDERRRCELLLGLAEAKEWANDTAGSRAVFEQAAEVARRLDATDLFLRAALGVGAVAARKFTAAPRCAAAPELLREALTRIDSGDVIARARLLSRLALHSLTTGQRAEAGAQSLDAVAMARESGDTEALGQALTARHAVLLGPDGIDERRAIALELQELGHRTGNRELLMRGHALHFTVLFELGDLLEAERALAAHRTLTESSGDPFELWVSTVWRAACALHRGEYADAERLANEAYGLVTRVPGLHTDELYGPISYAAQSILLREPSRSGTLDIEQIRRYRAQFPEASTWRVAWLGFLTKLERVDEVRDELDEVMKHGLGELDRNGSWFATMSYVAEAIEMAGNASHAAVAYALLEPFAERNVTSSHLGSRGSVSHYLALLASTLGRWDDAQRHFDVAIAMNRRMGARPYLARALYDRARLLLRRDVADRREVEHLVRQALSDAEELGMTDLGSRCVRLLGEIRRGPDGRSQPLSAIELEQQGDVWIVTHAGHSCFVKHAKGLIYLSELLRRPNAEVASIDLLAAAAAFEDVECDDAYAARDAGLGSAGSLSEDVVDDKARRAYHRRIAEVESRLASARSRHEPDRILELEEELEALRRELARAEGLGGRSRQTSDAERARVSVTRAIKLAVGRIADANPKAGAHLARSVRTGTCCGYFPPVDG